MDSDYLFANFLQRLHRFAVRHPIPSGAVSIRLLPNLPYFLIAQSGRLI
jgi:hypothetical protein